MTPLTGYAACKKITVKTTYLDAALTDFPLVYKPTADTDIGGRCLASGYDIRFTASDGTTLLSYKRIYFNIAAGAATGVFRIKSSLSTSPATDVYVHYGNASAPDVSSGPDTHRAVDRASWDMCEAAGGANAILDSTGNANHLTDYGSPTFGEDGPIYKSIYLAGNPVDGNNTYLEAEHSASLSLGGSFSLLAWIKKVSYASYEFIISKEPATGGANGYPGNYEFRIENKYPTLLYERTAPYNLEQHAATAQVTNDAWTRIAVVVDYLNTITFYVNGVPSGSFAQSYAQLENIRKLRIGTRADNYSYCAAWVADVQIIAEAQSAAWLKFEYYNITEADNCLTIGSEEVASIDLVPAENVQVQVIDTPTIVVIHVLGPSENTQVQVVDVPTLVVTHVLAPIELYQLQIMDTPTIAVIHVLAPTESYQVQVIDGPITLEVQSTDNMKYTARKNIYNIMR